MSTHTPGPWTLVRMHSYANRMNVCAENVGAVASYVLDDNAALIAAAPDLLAACETMFEWDKAEKEPYSDEVLSRRLALAGKAFSLAGAAIAKARGQ